MCRPLFGSASAALAWGLVLAVPGNGLASSAAAPQLDPAAVTTDTRLSPAVGKALVQTIADYNARRYDAAASDLANARSIPGRSSYDDFQINNVTLTLDVVRQDYASGAALAETMAASPALTESQRKAVYDDAVIMYAGARRYWRAIQFGGLLERENLLDPATTITLAKAYETYGSYADGERVAQAALDRGGGDADQRKQLTDTLGDIQVKEGKRDPTPGQALVTALFAGAVAGLAQGLTGQQVDPGAGMMGNATQRQGSAQDAARQAQQRAAAELLDQDSMSLRLVYTDLTARSAQLSPSEKKRSERNFNAASDAYGREDYPAAKDDLQDVLAIDPANATANYYYADCLARGQNDSLKVIDYLARALAFDRDGEARQKAREALQGIASPPQQNGG